MNQKTKEYRDKLVLYDSSDRQYLDKIDKFYQKKLNRYELITIGNTPKILQKLGAQDKPIQISQKTLNKITREPVEGTSKSAHNLSREIVEKIPYQIENPVFVIKEESRNSLALISELKDKEGRFILTAIKLDVEINGIFVNEVKSVYGRDNLDFYLNKQSEENVYIIDTKRAKEISRVAGLQLSAAWKSLDYNNNVAQTSDFVNSQTKITEDILKSGYQPTKKMVRNIEVLNDITHKENLLKEICTSYKGGCHDMSTEEKKLIEDIAKECGAQELSRLPVPE